MNTNFLDKILIALGLILSVYTTSFSQGITTNIGFDVLAGVPIDQRTVINTLADTSTINWPYEGLYTHVKDIDEYWRYTGTQWELFQTSGLNNFYISNDTLYAVSTDSTYSVFLPYALQLADSTTLLRSLIDLAGSQYIDTLQLQGDTLLQISLLGDNLPLVELDLSPLKDNLGNHIMTQNLQTNGNWISGDGGNEGIKINSTGQVGLNINGSTSYQLAIRAAAGKGPLVMLNPSSQLLGAFSEIGAFTFSNGYQTIVSLDATSTPAFGGERLRFTNDAPLTSGGAALIFQTGGNNTSTSGSYTGTQFVRPIQPSSGNASFTVLSASGLVAPTGTFSGSTTGITYNPSGTRTVGTHYGLTIVPADMKNGLGTATPSYILDINSTDAVRLPVGTTAQRPTGANGLLRYNSDSTAFEGYYNAQWNTIADRDWVLSNSATSEVNDLTSVVTWANVPDANITQSSVLQHQGALTIDNIPSRRIPIGTGTGIISATGFQLTTEGTLEWYSSTGADNTGAGGGALRFLNGTSTSNSAFGVLSMGTGIKNNADLNSSFGAYSLAYITEGDYNTSLGAYSGLTLTTGSNNLFGGVYAGDNITTGSGNILLGTQAGANDATYNPDNMIAIGNRAAYNVDAANSESIFIGAESGLNEATYSDLILIGSQASATQSNQIVIGHEKTGFESTQLKSRNYRWNIDQTLGASQDGYVMTYNNTSGELELQAGDVSDGNGIFDVANDDGTIPATFEARLTDILYFSDSSGNEFMTLNGTTQQVGIGTIPSYDLDVDGTFGVSGTVRFEGYGVGLKEAADLSKTRSGYIATYATDGTLLEEEFTNPYGGESSLAGILDSLYANQGSSAPSGELLYGSGTSTTSSDKLIFDGTTLTVGVPANNSDGALTVGNYSTSSQYSQNVNLGGTQYFETAQKASPVSNTDFTALFLSTWKHDGSSSWPFGLLPLKKGDHLGTIAFGGTDSTGTVKRPIWLMATADAVTSGRVDGTFGVYTLPTALGVTSVDTTNNAIMKMYSKDLSTHFYGDVTAANASTEDHIITPDATGALSQRVGGVDDFYSVKVDQEETVSSWIEFNYAQGSQASLSVGSSDMPFNLNNEASGVKLYGSGIIEFGGKDNSGQAYSKTYMWPSRIYQQNYVEHGKIRIDSVSRNSVYVPGITRWVHNRLDPLNVPMPDSSVLVANYTVERRAGGNVNTYFDYIWKEAEADVRYRWGYDMTYGTTEHQKLYQNNPTFEIALHQNFVRIDGVKNTIDSSGVKTPINFLYTDETGKVLSGGIGALSGISFLAEDVSSSTISPATLKVITGETIGSDYAINARTSGDSLILKFFPAGLLPMSGSIADAAADQLMIIDVSESPDKAKRLTIQNMLGGSTAKTTPANAATVDFDANGLMGGKIQVNMTNVTTGITLSFSNMVDGGDYLIYFTNVTGTDTLTLPSGCINLQGDGSTVSSIDITENTYYYITYDGTNYYFR